MPAFNKPKTEIFRHDDLVANGPTQVTLTKPPMTSKDGGTTYIRFKDQTGTEYTYFLDKPEEMAGQFMGKMGMSMVLIAQGDRDNPELVAQISGSQVAQPPPRQPAQPGYAQPAQPHGQPPPHNPVDGLKAAKIRMNKTQNIMRLCVMKADAAMQEFAFEDEKRFELFRMFYYDAKDQFLADGMPFSPLTLEQITARHAAPEQPPEQPPAQPAAPPPQQATEAQLAQERAGGPALDEKDDIPW